MNLRLALRNLARNRWRTALTMAGIAVAVGLLVWIQGLMGAFVDLMVQGAVGVQLGHVQVHTEDWLEEPSLFHGLPVDGELLPAVRGAPGVVAASPRVLAFGLVGHEKRSAVARLFGVEPGAEARVTGLDRGIRSGRWLSPTTADGQAPRGAEAPAPVEAVLGQGLARLLDVAEGDELVVFLQAADGSLGNDVLKVVGVVATASSMLDRMAVYIPLADAQMLAALDGRAHEIAILGADAQSAEPLAAAVRAALPAPAEGAPALRVRPWGEIVPDFHAIVGMMDAQMLVMYLIVYLIAALGILNTQRMAVLERRRELGVLLALGIGHRRLGSLVVLETVLLTALGALAGVVGGGALSLHHATSGFDMGTFTDGGNGGFSYMGIVFDERIYFDITARGLLEPALVVVFVAVLCGLWPAIKAARLDAVRAIAGRT